MCFGGARDVPLHRIAWNKGRRGDGGGGGVVGINQKTVSLMVFCVAVSFTERVAGSISSDCHNESVTALAVAPAAGSGVGTARGQARCGRSWSGAAALTQAGHAHTSALGLQAPRSFLVPHASLVSL